MNDLQSLRRKELFREALVFQLKLMADGLRDLVLLPVSLMVALAGLIRGGDDPGKGFREVLELGRQSERWINLFGHYDPLQQGGPPALLDRLLGQVEGLVRQQAQEGGISESTRKAVDRVLQAAHRGQGEKPVLTGEERKTDT